MELGFIGLGKMGLAMVERLLSAGHTVHVWNRTAEKCQPALELGAKLAASPKDAASYDMVFSMLMDDQAILDLIAAPNSFLESATRLWVDCSSISPDTALAAGEAARRVGINFLNAPVSGNPSVVRSGNLIFAISGASEAIAAAEPVLLDIGRSVHVVGESNQASVVKICTNALLGVLMQSLSEVAVLGELNGVDRRSLLSFINDSAVGSPFSKYKTQALIDLDMTPTFTNEGAVKDLKLAVSIGHEKASLSVVKSALTRFEKSLDSGIGSGKDIAASLLQAAQDSGIELH